jgi:hypothetical protein
MADRRGSARRRAAARALAGLVALLLVACSATPTAAPTAGPTVPPAATASVAPTASGAAPTQSLTPASSAISAAPPCAAAGLKASHDLVEGAAGSQYTTVVLVAASRCSIGLFPAVGLRDANGRELVGSTAGGTGRIDLDPNASYTSAVQLSNWCSPDPAFPLMLVIRIGADEVAVTGSSFPDEGDMPPCNGGGGPQVKAGQWEVAP